MLARADNGPERCFFAVLRSSVSLFICRSASVRYTTSLLCRFILFVTFLFLCFSACLFCLLFASLLVHVFFWLCVSSYFLFANHHRRYFSQYVCRTHTIGQYASQSPLWKLLRIARDSQFSGWRHFNQIAYLPKEYGNQKNTIEVEIWKSVGHAGDIFYFWTSPLLLFAVSIVRHEKFQNALVAS